MKVLIVEDERALADALEHIVRHAGYSADAVYNGSDALAYALGAAYDVILLDVMLPDMDGFQIVSALRARGNHTPVLMLTARTAIADKVTGLNAGADDYMTKPFDNAELLARLNALGRRTGGSGDERAAPGRSDAGSQFRPAAHPKRFRAAEQKGIRAGAAVSQPPPANAVRRYDFVGRMGHGRGRYG